MIKRAEKAPSPRQLRVGEELRHALAHLLERGEVRDPGLGTAPITVTEVRVSADLRNATAFVIPLGAKADQPETRAAVAALTRAAPFLRHHVARLVRLKFVPTLAFRADASFAEAERIENLLKDTRVRRDLVGPGQNGGHGA